MLKRLITSVKKLPKDNKIAVMLTWCLRQITDFTLEFSLNGKFVFTKRIFGLNIIVRVCFPLIACVDEVVNNQASDQGHEYDVYFLQYHKLTVINFMNGEVVC